MVLKMGDLFSLFGQQNFDLLNGFAGLVSAFLLWYAIINNM